MTMNIQILKKTNKLQVEKSNILKNINEAIWNLMWTIWFFIKIPHSKTHIFICYQERNFSRFRQFSEHFFGKNIMRMQKPSVWSDRVRSADILFDQSDF